MLFSSAKKNHEKAVDKYNTAVAEVQHKCDELSITRKECVAALEDIEGIINSIANTPKKIDRSVTDISIKRVKYRETKSFAKEAIINTAMTGARATLGVGAAIAGIKSRNLIVRLTLLISSLILILLSIFSFRKKDKQIAFDTNSDAKSLNSAAAQLSNKGATITNIQRETNSIYTKLIQQVATARPLLGRDYKDMSKEEKSQLGALVNNTLSLVEMLNKTAEHK